MYTSNFWINSTILNRKLYIFNKPRLWLDWNSTGLDQYWNYNFLTGFNSVYCLRSKFLSSVASFQIFVENTEICWLAFWYSWTIQLIVQPTRLSEVWPRIGWKLSFKNTKNCFVLSTAAAKWLSLDRHTPSQYPYLWL